MGFKFVLGLMGFGAVHTLPYFSLMLHSPYLRTLPPVPLPSGLPEPAQVELARMAEDLKRMHAFMGMNPAGAIAVAQSQEAARQAGAAPGDARNGGAMDQWGAPGREGRQPGQEVRSMGKNALRGMI